MGQASSQDRPSTLPREILTSLQSLPFLRRVEFFMDLEPFPDEILILIFSFVPEQDLLSHCRLVSQRWKRLVDSPSLWRMKCELDYRRVTLLVAEMSHDLPWQKMYLKKPFSRNLLRNPCGTEQLNHWSVKHGGDGWRVEKSNSVLEGADSQICFVSSFGWCKKGQIIDLVREGLWEHLLDVHQPPICISDWYAGREDCSCVYSIKVQLLAADQQTVLREFTMDPDPIPQWNDACYNQVSHEFRHYGPGVRYVNFTHKGKDMQFWKGWYGARISNSSVTVKCDNLEPCR
ncbi:F-box only protein 27-like [Bufo gargarizans]|uniref:F-box only protein 27-like n=1 Tax=Bufo gargarizans TaxID=30331 RepID=UPI001CF599C8|nr:F-box only protein 27-like [Bufo gargarizans]XP_044124282.1 F-box only protein 27-like [Bufo gargarizans]XP_044124283.1 F-box only protein 27-like [Bufo gargarizans]